MRQLRLSLVILFSVAVSACSGPTVQHEDLLLRDGVFFEKFSTTPFNGQTSGAFVGKIVDGQWDETVFQFDLNGQLVRETDYVRGIPHGKDLIFSDGDLFEESYYLEGELTSFKRYKLGYVTVSETFKDGKPHGQWEYFHLLGDPMYQVTFDEGQPIETELEVLKSSGDRLIVPIFYDTKAGIVADGVVRLVGDDTCAVKYVKGAKPSVLFDPNNESLSPFEESRLENDCLKKITPIIDYADFSTRTRGGLFINKS